VLVTHDLELALRVSDCVAFMKSGSIEGWGAAEDVLLTFGGIFAREAFHAPYWLITLTLKRQTSPFRAG